MPVRAKISAFCLAVVLVLGLSGLGEAGAARKSVSSQISLTSLGSDGAAGTVSNPRDACLGGRDVTLYQVNSGGSVPSSFPVASTTTHRDGSWTIARATYPYEYYAAVAPDHTRRFNCGGDTSESKSF
jgi:hypothetical protein